MQRPRYLSPQERVRSPVVQQKQLLMQVGKYIYDRNQVIGKGQYSVVYKGWELITNQLVAVKVIKNNQQMIDNEINILKSVTSPYIVKYLCHKVTNTETILITQLAKGDLSQKMLQQLIPESEAINIVTQMCKALQVLHDQNIIHGDVKSSNILIADKYLLADFGFACKMDNAQKSFILGTPLYMAPELLLLNKCTPAADVWSLGCVFYEMLFGKLPFRCSKQSDLLILLEQFKNEGLRIPKQQISKKALNLLQMMLQYEAEQRITVSQILELIEQQIKLVDLVQYFYRSYQHLLPYQNITLNYLYLKLINIYYQAYLNSEPRPSVYLSCQNEFFELEKHIKQEYSELITDEFAKYFNGNFNMSNDFLEFLLNYFKNLILQSDHKQIKDKLIANIAILHSVTQNSNQQIHQQVQRFHRMKSKIE